MKGRHHHRQRRAFAVAACVLWLLGVEVLPNLHLAVHHDDHTHAAYGTLGFTDDDDHEHDADHADHDVDHGDADHDIELDHPEPERHAAGGISHHAVALHHPPPLPLAPVEVARASWR